MGLKLVTHRDAAGVKIVTRLVVVTMDISVHSSMSIGFVYNFPFGCFFFANMCFIW